MLTLPDVTITQVAQAAGYDSQDPLSRAFQAQFEVLSSAYRRNDGSLAQARRYSAGQPLFYHLTPDIPPFDMQIRSFALMWVAPLRYTGPYDDCCPAWETLMAAMQSKGLLTAETSPVPSAFTIRTLSHVEKCSMEVYLSLPPGMTVNTLAVRSLLQDKRIYLRVIVSNSDYAVIEVKGPYSLLHPAYRSLYRQLLPQSMREPDAPQVLRSTATRRKILIRRIYAQIFSFRC